MSDVAIVRRSVIAGGYPIGWLTRPAWAEIEVLLDVAVDYDTALALLPGARWAMSHHCHGKYETVTRDKTGVSDRWTVHLTSGYDVDVASAIADILDA